MTPDKIMAKKGITVAEQLQRSLRVLVLATVFLYLALGGLSFKVWNDSRNTSDALCTFRQDLERRVISTTDFLRANPQGIPGISPKIILEGLANQQRTITSLKDLHCQPVTRERQPRGNPR